MHWGINNVVKRFSYRNDPYFYHYLVFLMVWYTIRAFQWYDYQPDQIRYILQNTIYDICVSALLCWGYVTLAKRVIQARSLFLKIGVLIIVSLIYPTVYLTLTVTLKTATGLELHTHLNRAGILGSTYRNMLFVLTINGMFFWTFYREQYRKQLEISQTAESLAKDAKLLMLRYQINPHFLFNILNSLYALVDEDKTQAKALILKLSDYYRSALKNDRPMATLEEELGVVTQYLEIQKIRFGEQLRTDIRINETLLAIKIPCFVIHLLVENAVKYASRGPDHGITIEITVTPQSDESCLIIVVSNPGRIKTAKSHSLGLEKGTHNGLENIRKRLELYYGANTELELKERADFVDAIIKIPIQKEALST